MKILAALALAFLAVSALPGESAAGPLPAQVSEFQPAKAPEGARQLCRNYAWACGSVTADALEEESEIEAAAREVNLAVNRKVRPVNDADNYGMAENWTLPAGNRGDCEDYALLKKKLLIERGVPAERLLLTVVIKNSLEPHVVLLFRGAEADYLLDNMTDAMLPWHLTGYTVVKMQSAADKTAWSAVLLGPLASRESNARMASAPRYEERQVADNSTLAEPRSAAQVLRAGRRDY